MPAVGSRLVTGARVASASPKVWKARLRVGRSTRHRADLAKSGGPSRPEGPPLAFLKPPGSCFPVSVSPSTNPPSRRNSARGDQNSIFTAFATLVEASRHIPVLTLGAFHRLRHFAKLVGSPRSAISFFRVCPCGPCFGGANVIARDSRVSSQATPPVPQSPHNKLRGTRNPSMLTIE